jgi:hypothetical protein
MKRLFILLLLMVWIVNAADSTAVFSADSTWKGHGQRITQIAPSAADRAEFILFDNQENTSDTIAADDYLIIGAFPLIDCNGAPQYDYFNLVGSQLATGDSLAVSYQLSYSKSVLDTTALWTACDTIGPRNGPKQTVNDISTVNAKYIWFRFFNFTATAAIASDWQYVMFGKKGTYYYRMK